MEHKCFQPIVTPIYILKAGAFGRVGNENKVEALANELLDKEIMYSEDLEEVV